MLKDTSASAHIPERSTPMFGAGRPEHLATPHARDWQAVVSNDSVDTPVRSHALTESSKNDSPQERETEGIRCIHAGTGLIIDVFRRVRSSGNTKCDSTVQFEFQTAAGQDATPVDNNVGTFEVLTSQGRIRVCDLQLLSQ